MNIRNIVLAAALAATGIANAQSFSLRAVSGATLSGNTFSLTASSFTVDVVLTLTAPVTISSLTGALAFGTGTAASPVGPLTIATKGYSAWALSNFATNTSDFVVRNAATSAPNGYLTTTGNLPLVSYFARGASPAITLAAGEYTFATFTFNSAIANNDTYGDAANEAGLQMVTQTGAGTPNLGSSGYTGARVGSQKYAVQAVPEPATMLVLGAGLAAIARRRKNA